MRNSTTQHNTAEANQQKATHRGPRPWRTLGGVGGQHAEPLGPQHQSCEQVQFGGRVRYKPIIEAFSSINYHTSINYHSAQSPTCMNTHFKMPFKGQGRVYPSRTCAPTVFGLSSIGSLGQYIGHFWGISHRGTLVGVHPIIPEPCQNAVGSFANRLVQKSGQLYTWDVVQTLY